MQIYTVLGSSFSTEKGIKEMSGAAKELEKATEAADQARPLIGTNTGVDEKLAKMEEKLTRAETEAAAGNLVKAIKEFSATVKEADRAFDAAAAP